MRMRKRWMLVATALVALNVTLWLAQGGFALPSYLFGNSMIRAEVVVKQGSAIHDYRIDRGKIRAVATKGTLTVVEKDGTIEAIPVAPTARITIAGRVSDYLSLRKNMSVTTVRDGVDSPATIVEAKRK
jgi:hypothetical protein